MNKGLTARGKLRVLFQKVIPAKLRWKCKRLIVQLLTKGKAPQFIEEEFETKPIGINLVGDVQIENGLGQSMRLLTNALEMSRYDYSILNLPMTGAVRREDHTWDHRISQSYDYGINLLHINPQDLGMAYLNTEKDLWDNRYNIGFWLWELEEFPKEFQQNFRFVDEIWTPSEFASDCFRKITDKPVYTLPYHITAETDEAYNRAYFRLPEDKFLYLIMFDLNSTMSRKNPLSAIQAFRKAFDRNDNDVGLVVKVNNPTKECMDTLRGLLAGYDNVYFVSQTMDKPEVNALIGCADAFVSLHHAEGFGLVMAEAMLLKTACIATNWSSNTEFMNSDVACMVSYTLVHFPKGEGSYADGGTWAEADIEEAAYYMRLLKNNPALYKQMVDKAYEHIKAALGKDKIVGLLEKRISEIYEELGVEI